MARTHCLPLTRGDLDALDESRSPGPHGLPVTGVALPRCERDEPILQPSLGRATAVAYS
jgi:hypothetical protein